MKIVVLLKFFKGELNPFDGAALEAALECGGEITVLSMAPPSVSEPLKTLTRLGIRAILISDPLYAGADTLATSYVLAEAIQKLNPDAVFAGRQSMDGDTAQVPPMLAQRLGMEIVPGVMELHGEGIKTRVGKEAKLKSGTVYTFERIRTLRFPSIFSKVGTVELWNQSDLRLDAKKCGLQGSFTRVLRSYESAVGRRSCQFLNTAAFDATLKTALKKDMRVSSLIPSREIEKIYYVGNIAGVAEGYAKTAIKLEAAGKDAETFSNEVRALGAQIVLFESTEEYRILAARSAVITESGICADCISFREENGAFVMTRPALGGNVTADIVSMSDMSFATVRQTENKGTKIVFSIGKGALPYLEEIRLLAEKYEAVLTCSRPIVDGGFLPYSYQVGATGKSVSPIVYVAFGISGAVQHTSAITGAGTVISVNTDRNARIFDYSDYGFICDVKTLLKEI